MIDLSKITARIFAHIFHPINLEPPMHDTITRWYLMVTLVCFLVAPLNIQADPASNSLTEEDKKYRQMLDKHFQKGLSYLMDQQMDETGAWPGPKGHPNVAVTAFAVKILADGPPRYLVKYKDEFEAGVKFILNAQKESGMIAMTPKLANYSTATGLMGLVAARDAYAKWDYEKFRPTIQKGRKYLVDTQFQPDYHDIGEAHWAYGGFDYSREEEKPDADMSNTQFALGALKAADLPQDSPTWKRAVSFLMRSQNRSESNDLKEYFKKKGYSIGDDGGFMYYPAKSYGGEKTLPSGETIPKSYGTMTYAGLKSFIYAGLDKRDPRVQAAYNWIQHNYTLEKNPGMSEAGKPEKDKQGLYYYYHTFAKALHEWGDPYLVEKKEDGSDVRHQWSRELVKKLVELQREDGSWKNEVGRWMEDYPPLATSYCLLALNICRKWVHITEKK